MHTHGWIPSEELKNGYTQTDSMPTVKQLREQAKTLRVERLFNPPEAWLDPTDRRGPRTSI